MKPRRVTVLVVIALVVAGGSWLTFRRQPEKPPAREASHTRAAGAGAGAREQKLVVEDLIVGAGAPAQKGSRVSIHYTGWVNLAKFDSSLSRAPLAFQLGRREVLAGWDQGIVGMRVGGKRRLTVPPSLAYGKTGSPGGAIPPMSTLVFEIELLDATAPSS